MTHSRVLSAIGAALLLGGCAAQSTPAQSSPAPSTAARATRHGPGYTRADVEFMQGMIGHHAQAIVMAKWCPSHGASAQLRIFCDKVIRSQQDEIDFMQTWLRDRGEMVPDPNDPHAMHMMHHMAMDSSMKMDSTMKMDMNMGHEMLMPGMLTAAQLAQLDSARGTEFDRLFLTDMIRHHEGALTMVAKLFDTPGAGQTPEIFGYATGVDADQRAEIERMQRMLTTITGRTPQ
ncbi:MAG TPA: DUF305 domain-containing protein [Gemmatimonadaceae bacterium]|nr:DUF305 domain-containing protein [Gemmatimonadaceae bacterium]